MKKNPSFSLLLISLCLVANLYSQSASGIIDPSRMVDWSRAGIPNGIPNRTTVCSTLSEGATASQINSAITSCPSGQVVKLNAGTYNLSSGLKLKSNVTLRGAGPDQTKLVFSGSSSCGGFASDVCFIGDSSIPGSGGTLVNWTAGYSKGTTQITFNSTSGLSAGSVVYLDQLDDSNTDSGAIWVCGTDNVCSDEGPSGGQRIGRSQQQIVKVIAINGNVVTISPEIYMPNWRSSQSPQAWWTANVIKMAGIENLSLDHSGSNAQSGAILFNAYNCWLKNIKSTNSDRNHVWLVLAAANVIRDSYFYGTKNAQSQSYGVESYLGSDNLIENNIFQHIVAPIMLNGGSSGSVLAYNYSIDNYYTSSPSTMMGQIWLHAAGIDNVLIEGNTGAALFGDIIHGTHHFVTAFRNFWIGWETGKTDQIFPVGLQAFNRYMNLIGNVLGRAGTHTLYQNVAGQSGSGTPIFRLGYGTSTVPNDARVAQTLFRWGNYDVVTNSVRWEASEVPSAINPYGNAVPGSQNLPASFYLSAKPPWWGAVAWPPIGPDVTGGTGPGGRAHMIPAQLCYVNSAKDANGILIFNAANCYSQSDPGAGSPPPPPANLLRTAAQ